MVRRCRLLFFFDLGFAAEGAEGVEDEFAALEPGGLSAWGFWHGDDGGGHGLADVTACGEVSAQWHDLVLDLFAGKEGEEAFGDVGVLARAVDGENFQINHCAFA